MDDCLFHEHYWERTIATSSQCSTMYAMQSNPLRESTHQVLNPKALASQQRMIRIFINKQKQRRKMTPRNSMNTMIGTHSHTSSQNNE